MTGSVTENSYFSLHKEWKVVVEGCWGLYMDRSLLDWSKAHEVLQEMSIL